MRAWKTSLPTAGASGQWRDRARNARCSGKVFHFGLLFENYSREHPEYENNRVILTIQNIEQVHSKRLEKHDFGNA